MKKYLVQTVVFTLLLTPLLYGGFMLFYLEPKAAEQKALADRIAKTEKENAAASELLKNADQLRAQAETARTETLKFERRVPSVGVTAKIDSDLDAGANLHGLTFETKSNQWVGEPKPGLVPNTLSLTLRANGTDKGLRQLDFLNWIALYPQLLAVKKGGITFEPENGKCLMKLDMVVLTDSPTPLQQRARDIIFGKIQ